MFKVHNRNSRTRCAICSKLIIKASEQNLKLTATLNQEILLKTSWSKGSPPNFGSNIKQINSFIFPVNHQITCGFLLISGKNSLNFRREIERRSVLLWECLYHYTFTKYPQNPKLKSGKVWRIMSVWFESYDITKNLEERARGRTATSCQIAKVPPELIAILEVPDKTFASLVKVQVTCS